MSTVVVSMLALLGVMETGPDRVSAEPVGDQSCRAPGARAITYVGVTRNQPDLEAAAMGTAGSFFPQFDAPAPVTGRPTGENARDALPAYVGPLIHFPEDPDFAHRTFSQDGPARSAGGQPGWDALTLPGGATGASGAIIDPATAGNTNNTVNRIQLRGEVPATFYFSIVTDNTARQHDPTGLVRARGNVGPVDRDDTQVEADTAPSGEDLLFDGMADVYTFRYDGFAAGDYLKVRLATDADSGGASLGGLLFDENFAGDGVGPAPLCAEARPALPSPPEVSAEPARPVPAHPNFTG